MELVTQFNAHDSYVLDLCFTPDNNQLISASMDNQIKIWGCDDWSLTQTLSGHRKSVNGISISTDGQRLLSGSSDHCTLLWSLEDGRLLHTYQDRKQVVSAVAIAPDDSCVAQVSYSGRLMVWQPNGDPLFGVKVQKRNLGSVAISPDSRLIATSGLGGEVNVYALPSGKHVTTLRGHQIAAGSLQFVRNGRYLLSVGLEQTIKLWDAVSWQKARSILTPIGTRTVAVDQRNTTVALLREGEVQVWSLPRWSERDIIPISTKSISGVAFSPNGKWLAVGAADKRIRVWKL